MSLYVIATPIGNNDDMGLRALSILREVEVIITEERKEGSKLLRHHGISGIPLEVLNEHTDREDIDRLVEICRTKSTALISDAGTPGFCDPGAELVSRCRKAGIRVQSVPGPSSLMSLLSICGRRLDQFFFRGFISAKTEERISQLAELKNVKIPVVLMDTPYRLKKILAELAVSHPENLILLGLNLSQAEEEFLEGTAKKVLSQLKVDKAEFVLILLPSK
ncbi:MAG: methyltransferase [Bdellovibrionales bacterium]|nr:methyltransferase [Bdellovibrionales bacterium]